MSTIGQDRIVPSNLKILINVLLPIGIERRVKEYSISSNKVDISSNVLISLEFKTILFT
jgi:hypothetical protein